MFISYLPNSIPFNCAIGYLSAPFNKKGYAIAFSTTKAFVHLVNTEYVVDKMENITAEKTLMLCMY